MGIGEVITSAATGAAVYGAADAARRQLDKQRAKIAKTIAGGKAKKGKPSALPLSYTP
ncbi:MAG: hypothetical protein ACRDQZ_25830 [Mycobacteriales bacterium]